MPIDGFVKEMEGRILITDNKRFLYYAGFIGVYYMAFLGFLTYLLLH